MSSSSQRAANYANAQSSTGPKTRAGRARSSRNARKHGLNIALLLDPEMSAAVEALADRIMTDSLSDSDPALLPLARRLAEAQLEVIRVRWARHMLIARAHDDPDYDYRDVSRFKAELLYRLECSVGRRRALLGEALVQALPGWLERGRGWPQRLSIALDEFADKLMVLERYERRAFSKRRAAVRAFDAARAASSPP